MARNLEPKHKMCRKYGEKLCDSAKCPVTRRSYPPGQHGPNQKNKKLSGYGRQLREKQKVKKIYGILERQFSNYVAEAAKKTGDTSKFLVSYLESRLDNVVYRLGLAKSRRAARQLVSHGHIAVNGKKVSIPSYRTRVGETVGIRELAKGKAIFQTLGETLGKVETPAWLSVDAKTLTGKVLNAPIVDMIHFDAKSIVEFYSR